MGVVTDLSGLKFGRWTVVHRSQRGGWHCRCECGTEKVVRGSALRAATSQSCGCLRSELSIERNTKHSHSQHRDASPSATYRLTLDGSTRTAAEWARELGVSAQVIYKRLSAGWSVQKTLTTAVKPRRSSSP